MKVFHNPKFRNLERLILKKNKLNLNGITILCEADLEKLKELNISETGIEKDGPYFLHKSNFKNLERLDISNNNIKEYGITYLLKTPFLKKLKYLNIAENQLRASETKILCDESLNFENLEELNISNNQIEDEGINYLFTSNFKNLSILNVEKNQIKNIDDLKFKLEKLKVLYFGFNKIDLIGLKRLENFKQLKELHVNHCYLFYKSFMYLIEKDTFNNLEVLNIENNSELYDELLEKLIAKFGSKLIYE